MSSELNEQMNSLFLTPMPASIDATPSVESNNINTVVISTFNVFDNKGKKYYWDQGLRWKTNEIVVDEKVYEFLKMIRDGNYQNVRISLTKTDFANEEENILKSVSIRLN
jgi:hypothetical protein